VVHSLRAKTLLGLSGLLLVSCIVLLTLLLDRQAEGGCSGRMMDFSRISAKLTPLLGQVVGERSLGRLPG
jgi:hypothetical protein